MTEVVTATPAGAPEYRDRSGGLIAFGIAHLAFGLFCALFVLAVAAASSRAGVPALPRATLASNIIVYGVLTLYFIAVGVGSIRRRRWARSLALAVSWLWLVFGVLTTAVAAIVMPRLMVLTPPSRGRFIVTAIFIALGVGYIAVPAIFIAFYRSPHVKTTVERHDPIIRWTDRAPLPILALAIALAFGALSLFASASYATLPLLGSIVTGGPATLIVVTLAGLLLFLAVQLYRLKQSAWWAVVLLQVIGLAVGAVTLLRTDFNALYQQMGIMTPQLQATHLADIYRSPVFWGAALLAWGGFFAFLLYLRRYFEGSGPRTRAGDLVPDVA